MSDATINRGWPLPEHREEFLEDLVREVWILQDADMQAAITPPSARVYHNAAQSIPNATLAALSFNSERFDTDSIHSTSSNTSRLTCNTAGLYLITGAVAFDANAAGIRSLRVRLNGATYLANQQVNASGGGLDSMLTVSTLYQMAAGDYVEMVVYQNSGGSLNCQSASNYSPEFGMVKVG